jgi:hypothetical protein
VVLLSRISQTCTKSERQFCEVIFARTLNEFSRALCETCFLAYKKGRLSKAKLAEMLDTSLIDLPKTLQEYGHKDREGYDAEVRVA